LWAIAKGQQKQQGRLPLQHVKPFDMSRCQSIPLYKLQEYNCPLAPYQISETLL
jgi:hypothetical protein